jgi:hypothetical protein
MIQQKKPHKEKMIESSQRMIGEQKNNNPAINKHFKLQIKRLQDAPRGDADNKLEWLLKVKEEREKHQEAMHIEDTHRKVGYRRD